MVKLTTFSSPRTYFPNQIKCKYFNLKTHIYGINNLFIIWDHPGKKVLLAIKYLTGLLFSWICKVVTLPLILDWSPVFVIYEPGRVTSSYQATLTSTFFSVRRLVYCTKTKWLTRKDEVFSSVNPYFLCQIDWRKHCKVSEVSWILFVEWIGMVTKVNMRFQNG